MGCICRNGNKVSLTVHRVALSHVDSFMYKDVRMTDWCAGDQRSAQIPADRVVKEEEHSFFF